MSYTFMLCALFTKSSVCNSTAASYLGHLSDVFHPGEGILPPPWVSIFSLIFDLFIYFPINKNWLDLIAGCSGKFSTLENKNISYFSFILLYISWKSDFFFFLLMNEHRPCQINKKIKFNSIEIQFIELYSSPAAI